MMAATDRHSENAMTATTGLKWSAAFFTVFWTAGMLLWSGVFDSANITITAVCGVIAGVLWYFIMRRITIRRGG
jgi:Flp pilus assembly protein TadB